MYDFTTRVERRNSTSIKWKLIEDDMGEGNDDVIAMSVADMEFKPAPQIVRAIVDAAQHDVFGYDYATDEYFAALAGWMARRHHMEVRPEWVTLSDGVMPAVNTALRAFTHPGDAIVIQRPVYYPFTSAAQHNGLTISTTRLPTTKRPTPTRSISVIWKRSSPIHAAPRCCCATRTTRWAASGQPANCAVSPHCAVHTACCCSSTRFTRISRGPSIR